LGATDALVFGAALAAGPGLDSPWQPANSSTAINGNALPRFIDL
jgi:hypothetical protein